MEIEPTRRPRGRPREFDVNEAVGRAALLFWERGYEAVSVDDLTTAMRITTQSFYAAFRSKRAVHEAALAWYDQEIVGPIQAVLNGEADVVLAVREALTLCARLFVGNNHPSGCLRSFAGIGVAKGNDEVAQSATRGRAASVAAIKARLNLGIAEGQLSVETKTNVMALYVNAVVVGMAVAARDGATLSDLLALAELAAATISLSALEGPDR